MTMTDNDALRQAAAQCLHAKRGDDQLIRIMQGEIDTLDDDDADGGEAP